MGKSWNRTASAQIELIAEKCEARIVAALKLSLPGSDPIDHFCAPFIGYRCKQITSLVVLIETERHNCRRLNSRIERDKIKDGLFQLVAVVDARTEYNLSVQLDAVLDEIAHLLKHIVDLIAAQKMAAYFEVGGV